MVDLDHLSADDVPATLAMVTMLSKNVYKAVADLEGPGYKLKPVIALGYLRELGSIGQKYFAHVLCMDANNTVLLLNELEADGLVVRKRDPADRRRHVIEMTDAGREVLRDAEARMFDIEADLLAALSEEQRAQFGALLHQSLYGENGVFQRALAGTSGAAA